MKKRSEPGHIEPISRGNVRYEAPPWGKSRGLGQNGGHVVAIDQATGRQLWVAQLYDIGYDPNMEEDKQDVFLSSLTLDASGSSLLAEDEHGRHYALDLFSRQVTVL
jgi:hypothetical protein